MATYVNNLRLTELATGEGSGTWGTTTNTSLELIGEALGYNTQDCFSTDADATTTIADGATDPARAFYFKVTSSATLTATRTLTIAPNTISRVMFIENATTGSQSIAISQGSGANVTIATGRTAVVYLDGAGSGAAVVDAMANVDPGVTDTLAEVLVAGNTTGGTDIQFSAGDNITNASGDFTIDIAGDLILDADGGDIRFLDGGTEFGRVFGSSNNFYIQARQTDKDMIFQGIDGGSTISALTLDMSSAGAATFNGNLTVNGADVTVTANIQHAGDTDTFYGFHGNDLWRVVTGGTERLEASNSGIIVNDSGADTDFRVESNSNTHMLFVDAGNDRIGINTSAPDQLVHIFGGNSGSAYSPDGADIFILENSDSAIIDIRTPAANSGGILFSDAGARGRGQILYSHSTDTLNFTTASAGRLSLSGSDTIFNDGSADTDFRVESNSIANMLFIDAGNDTMLVANNITMSANEIDVASGNLTVDVAGDIILDADGSDIIFADGGTQFGFIANSSSDMVIKPMVQDKDFIIKGNDGGSTITALTLDMSDAGFATFNNGARATTLQARLQNHGGDVSVSANQTGNAYLDLASTASLILGSTATTTVNSAKIVADHSIGSTGDHRQMLTFHPVAANSLNYEAFRIRDTEIVANETGSSAQDFRVESDNNTHMVFVDAGGDHVSIGTSSDFGKTLNVNGGLEVRGTGSTIELQQSATGSATYYAMDNTVETGGKRYRFGYSGGSADKGSWSVYNETDNILNLVLSDDANVFNEDSKDVDFRVESNNNSYMLFVDGGSDHVNIGTATDLGGKLNVNDSIYVAETDTPRIRLRNIGNSDTELGINGLGAGLDSFYIAQYAGIAANEFDFRIVGATREFGFIRGGVVNEGAGDSDFRVESNGNTHALFVDAGNNHVNINTSADAGGTLNVAGDIYNDLGSSQYFRRAKYIDPRNVSDGVYGGYLLLVPYNSGSAATGAAMEGTFVASRGNSGTGNGPSRCQVWCSAVYTNTLAWFKKEGADQFFQRLVRVTYNGTEYMALEFDQVNGGPVNGIYFDGWSIRADSNFLFMVRDTEITGSVVAFDTPHPYHYIETTNNQRFEYGVAFNEAGGDHDFRIESDTNTHAFFLDAGNNVIGAGTAAPATYVGTGGLAIKGATASDLSLISSGISSGVNSHQMRYWNDTGTAYEIARTRVNVGAGQVNRGEYQFAVNNGAGLRQWLDVDYLGNVRFNESGHDSDFRVESDNDSHMLFVDAGDDVVMFDGSSFVAIDGGTANGIAMRRAGRIVTCTEVGGNVMEFSSRTNGKVGTINVTASATSYNTSSDARLKENIADADDAGELIDAIQVRQFDWIADGEHQRYGMVAQELNTVAPEAVSEGETEDDMMAVDYSKLVPMLIKEIQSLRARVAQLESN